MMLLIIGAVSYGQTSPAKQGNSQKKEMPKKEAAPASNVSSVAPAKKTGENKPAAANSQQAKGSPATVRKHKKHTTTKKQK